MEKSINKHFIIDEQNHRKRIDIVLSELLKEYSRSLIAKWIKDGNVIINKNLCKPKDKVQLGDAIEVNVIYTEETNNFNECLPQDIPLNIIYEDEHILVVNKPAGLVVHPGAGNKDNTLVNALLYHQQDLKNLPRAGIIHRIDKDTTGLLVIAKNLKAHTHLIRQMQNRSVQRHYFALVYGYINSGGRIETGFGRHPKNRLKMSVKDEGKEAITLYSIKESFLDFSFLDIKLLTGRTHQIRVHMSYINHPIVGDQVYGGRIKFPPKCRDRLKECIQAFKRQALHAYQLTLFHPEHEKELTFTAPMPDDFNLILQEIRHHYEINKS